MFKQLPSSTAALYLQHQQSEWQRLCETLISHWTTVDRLTSSSHKNIVSAHRKNHSLWCGCFFKREYVFPVFSHMKPSPPERLAHYPKSCECTIRAKTSSTAKPGTVTGCHHVSDWEGKISRLVSQIWSSHMDKDPWSCHPTNGASARFSAQGEGDAQPPSRTGVFPVKCTFLTYQLPCHTYHRAQKKGYAPTFLQL